MALAPGARLGPYQILAPLGRGGMGEVYRARDPRLGREVAIKVVASGSGEPSRLARFEQEARAAAALNHPNILAVHDVGTAEIDDAAMPYVVAELLEGHTLRERMSQGPLPAREATELAIQVARGLTAAHARGIVHRDVKPENIFVTTDHTAKLLDFGVAKLRDEAAGPDEAAAATQVRAKTADGVVLGTAGYMAPEQVRAGAVDHRADIFALGAVMYEMLSGQRAFEGASGVETMHAILSAEPPELPLQASGVSSGLERVVRRCLEKDPAQRFESARDLAFALDAVRDSRPSSGAAVVTRAQTSSGSGRRRWLALAAALMAAAGASWMAKRPAPTFATPDPQVLRFNVDLPAGFVLPAAALPRISPDGRSTVLRSPRTAAGRLVLRDMQSGALSELAGTDGGGAAYWSPDGRSLLFRSGTRLRRLDLGSGAPTATLPADLLLAGNPSLTWGRSGLILAVDADSKLVSFSAQGDRLEPVALRLPDGQSPTSPEFLSDGRRFLLTTLPPGNSSLYLAEIGDDKPRLIGPGISGRVVYVDPGYVLYRRQAALVAQSINVEEGRLVGDPVVLAPLVSPNSFSASPSLVVHAMVVVATSTFVWHDRRTRDVHTVAAPGRYSSFDLSRDGRQIVASALSDDGGQSLVIIDGALGGRTPITSGAAIQDTDPRWSPDASDVIFGSTRVAGRGPQRMRVGSTTFGTPFAFPGVMFGLDDWSNDGQWLLYHDTDIPVLMARRLEGAGEPLEVARALTGTIDQAQMSPDGTFVAFNSSDSGRDEVFVVDFPRRERRLRISTAGGVQPTWRADGRELYYLALDGTLMAVQVSPGAPRQFSAPAAVLKLGSSEIVHPGIETYAPSPDGQRFLTLRPAGEAPRPSFSVIVNWQQLLKPAPAP